MSPDSVIVETAVEVRVMYTFAYWYVLPLNEALSRVEPVEDSSVSVVVESRFAGVEYNCTLTTAVPVAEPLAPRWRL
jgi:hypothetical protein